MADKPLAKRGGRVALNNALAIYDFLANNATMRDTKDLQEYGYPAKEGDQILVYEGYVLSTAGAEIGMRDSNITHALSTLKAMNSVTLLISGNKIRKSIYLLHYKPTIEQYEDFMGRSYAIERKTLPNRWDTMVNDMVVLRERLNVVERELKELREIVSLRGHTHGGHNV